MRRVSIALILWCIVLAAQDPAEATRKPVTTPEDLVAGLCQECAISAMLYQR